ncbi:ABC transporter substrate-binding protein [Flavobacterium sp.]|uniref:ABC transporter substrate-binding protein n=1 Tax=Flavobacterium sp. TaxID=239 RepID=UPI00260F35AF|nr:ABC transporter substrate-binding protein [Flavobacterium sp.]
MLKIGILLPRSTYYETIGFDLYEGLKQGLKHAGRDDIKLVSENIGFGADKQQCYRSAEKLILEENVSLVIGFIGHRTAQLLRPLFLAANKILIVLDAGANLPQEWSFCPNIIYHSLHNSLGAWSSAQMAVKDGYANGGMVTGYYDGGYLQTFSLSKGFEDAGGTICFNHATGYKKEDFSMEPLINHLNNYPNSALLSLFSGDFVQWYFLCLQQSNEFNNIPIYLSPFALEETMLEKAVFTNNSIKGIASWSKNIPTDENALFKEAMESSGRIPNLFSLISWESSQIIIKVLALMEENKNNLPKVADALTSFEFIAPRGKIQFHKETNMTLAPQYEVKIISDASGMCQLELGNEVTGTMESFEKLRSFDLEEVTSAWYNSYVCI